MAYINKKERQALYDAWDYVNNILESCTADPEDEEEKIQLYMLQECLSGLSSLMSKK